jgi:hypothetical protein
MANGPFGAGSQLPSICLPGESLSPTDCDRTEGRPLLMHNMLNTTIVTLTHIGPRFNIGAPGSALV